MSRSREIDEQIQALAEEKKKFQAETALARDYRTRQHGQRRMDDRELPLVVLLAYVHGCPIMSHHCIYLVIFV